MSACWPIQIPPTPKSVLMSLADNANDHGVCWPSISTICMRTCFGKTAVIEAIRWLEEHGLLEADRSNGRHTKYQIKPNGMAPELFDSTGNPSGSRTGTGGGPVRKAHQSGKRTCPAGEPNRSGRRTQPVREADTNRQEPSRTKREERAPAGTRLTPDWKPSEEDLDFARKLRPDLRVSDEEAKFRDYWIAQPGSKGRKEDWSAAWRYWIRNAYPAKAGDAPQATGPAAPDRDWRKPSETKLEAQLNFIQHLHNLEQIDDAERDRLIAEARQNYADDPLEDEA